MVETGSFNGSRAVKKEGKGVPGFDKSLVSQLEFHHRDSFDRLIIAQAILEDMAISRNSNFVPFVFCAFLWLRDLLQIYRLIHVTDIDQSMT